MCQPVILLHHGMPTGTTRELDEIIGDTGVMIVGGFQEPAHRAANTLHGLLTRPEQAARLAADPQAWSAKAVEEGLRWEAPFGMTEKLTTTELTVGAVYFAAGTEVDPLSSPRRTEPTRVTGKRTRSTSIAPTPAMPLSAMACTSAWVISWLASSSRS